MRLLANIETDSEKLLSLVIAGQPEIADHLNHPSLRQLKQRIELRCELRPLQRLETFTYLACRIRAAGGVSAEVFTRDAVEVIHERSRGNPRTINVIADNALIAGLALEQRPVLAQTVVEVCREFDIPSGGAPEPAIEPVGPSGSTSTQLHSRFCPERKSTSVSCEREERRNSPPRGNRDVRLESDLAFLTGIHDASA